MVAENTNLSVAITRVYIKSLHAERMVKGELHQSELDEAILCRKTDLRIEAEENNKFKLVICENIYFEPSGPFKLTLETIGDYLIDPVIPIDELEKIKENIAQPVFSFNSLVIAFITEKIINGPPIIIPPILEQEDSK